MAFSATPGAIIRIGVDGADASRREIDTVARTMSNLSNTVTNAMRNLIGGLGLGAGVSQIVQMSDAYAKFTAQLRLASTSTREYAAAYGDVKRIANVAQQDLGATGMLYARIANGTRELGVVQKKVAEITEVVNLALKVSGATATESASAQLQLSQAFASGTLRGEEFNAVNEAAPRLMLALADGIGKPVGALKKMAEEGQITSKIMADVLPNALAKLREEAKQVQTISGAFTVLKNNMMELVGIQANASGAVSALTGAIGFLASNLAVVAGAVATLTVAKLGAWLSNMVTRAASAAAANRVLATSTLAAAVASTEAASIAAAAKLAEAQANVRATASASALAAARVVELRAAVLATSGAVQLALAQNGLIPAQARAAAMAEANAIALAAQAVAANGATVASIASAGALTAQAAAAGVAARAMGILRGAVAFLGGPIGAILTVLGLGATAWMVWGNKAKEGNELAKETSVEASTVIIASLDKQISRHDAIIRLRNQGLTLDQAKKVDQAPINILGALSADLAALNARKGAYATLNNTEADFERIKIMRTILELTTKMKEAESKGAQATAITQGEARLKFMKDYATKQERMNEEIAEGQRLLGAAFTAADEARIRAKYSDKGAAAAAAQEANSYATLVTSIREKIAANELELSGTEKLSVAQKMIIKLDEAVATGKSKLTPRHIAEAKALIATVEAQDEVIASQKRAIAGGEDWERISKDHQATVAKTLADAEAEADRNVELARTYGMTKSAIEADELARLKQQLAQEKSGRGVLEEIERLEKLIAVKERSAAALLTIDNFEAQKKGWESVEKTAHDTFISIFDSGKSAFDRLEDTLKNGLLDLLYQMTVKKWIFNISAAVTGGSAGGLAQAAGITGPGGADLSSISGVVSAAKAAYSTISAGFSGIATSVTNTINSGINAISGTSAFYGPTAAGGNIAGASPFASAAGSVASVAAGAVVGVYGGRAISNGYAVSGSGNGVVNAGTGVGGVVGAVVGGPIGAAIGAAIGGLIGGVANRLFGRKAKEYGDTTLNGSFGANGFTGTNDTAWTQKGGLFRSNKSGVDKANVDAATARQFAAGYDIVKTASADFATTLGINADALKTRVQSLSIKLGKDQAENEKAVAEFFVGVGDKIAKELVPTLATFAKSGEGASATLQRIATNYAFVDVALTAISKTFGAVGIGSVAARERLVDLVGGLEAFGQGTAFFAQNFLTEAERMAPVSASVKAALAEMGLAFVDTREEFKAAVLGLKLADAVDAKTFAGLMKIQEAFAQVTPAVEAASNALAERADLQRELDELTMTGAQLAAKARAAVNDSNLALYDQVVMQRELKASTLAAAEALKGTVERLTAAKASTLAYRDSLLLGTLSTLTPMQKYLETQRQYAAALAKANSAPADSAAQSAVQGAATAFLSASQVINASSAAYISDKSKILGDMTTLAAIAGAQMTDAQMQLSRMDAQVIGIATLNSTAEAIEQAILNQRAPAAPVAPVFDAQRYAAGSPATESVLTDEVKALRIEAEKARALSAELLAEVKRMRVDAERHAADAGDIAGGVGDAISEGINGAVERAVYLANNPNRVSTR
jgi:tape measure domain-containing protein